MIRFGPCKTGIHLELMQQTFLGRTKSLIPPGTPTRHQPIPFLQKVWERWLHRATGFAFTLTNVQTTTSVKRSFRRTQQLDPAHNPCVPKRESMNRLTPASAGRNTSNLTCNLHSEITSPTCCFIRNPYGLALFIRNNTSSHIKSHSFSCTGL